MTMMMMMVMMMDFANVWRFRLVQPFDGQPVLAARFFYHHHHHHHIIVFIVFIVTIVIVVIIKGHTGKFPVMAFYWFTGNQLNFGLDRNGLYG